MNRALEPTQGVPASFKYYPITGEAGFAPGHKFTPKRPVAANKHKYLSPEWELFIKLPWEGKISALGALGLSNVRNLEKTPQRRRGKHGLTAEGRRKVMFGCQELGNRFGKDCLTFATVTLPKMPIGITEGWPSFRRLVLKAVQYHLERRGLCTWVVDVTENQEARSRREGRICPHLHMVFQGRKRRGSWAISPKLMTKIARQAFATVFGNEAGLDFKAATNIQRVKKDAGRYMAKYMSKGMQGIQSENVGDTKLEYVSSWYGLSRELLILYKRSIVTLRNADATGFMAWLHRHAELFLSRSRSILARTAGGVEYAVGWSGQFISSVTFDEVYSAFLTDQEC